MSLLTDREAREWMDRANEAETEVERLRESLNQANQIIADLLAEIAQLKADQQTYADTYARNMKRLSAAQNQMSDPVGGREAEVLREALVTLIEIHHNTIKGSKLHDPENQTWQDCGCFTCRTTRAALDEFRSSGSAAQPCAEEDHEWEMHCVRCGELWASGSAAQNQTVSLRICNNCDSVIGTVRAAMKLRDCPECYQSIVPVEDRTHAVSAHEWADRLRSSGSAAPPKSHHVINDINWESGSAAQNQEAICPECWKSIPRRYDELCADCAARSPQDEDHEEKKS